MAHWTMAVTMCNPNAQKRNIKKKKLMYLKIQYYC